MLPDFGFIIVRHVNNETTNKYWQEAYRCIRQWYRDPIIIVDDNSKPEFLTTRDDLINCEVVNGEFPAVGEMLGYYYFYKLHPFSRACVIHDGVFLNKKLDSIKTLPDPKKGLTRDVQFLWSFRRYNDEDVPTIELMSKFKDADSLVTLFLCKNKWLGCFGVMSVINWELLDRMNLRHDLFPTVLEHVSTRPQRCLMERIFACMCFLNDPGLNVATVSKFGDIFEYCDWGVPFEYYIAGKLNHLPVVKVWTGR